jgi:hypothetical protein
MDSSGLSKEGRDDSLFIKSHLGEDDELEAGLCQPRRIYITDVAPPRDGELVLREQDGNEEDYQVQKCKRRRRKDKGSSRGKEQALPPIFQEQQKQERRYRRRRQKAYPEGDVQVAPRESL